MKKIFSILISLVVLTSPVFAVTDYIYCDYVESDNANYNWYMSYGTNAQVSYPASVSPNSSASISIANLTLGCSRQGPSPSSCDTTAGQLGGIGDANFIVPASRNNPIVTLYGQPGDGANVQYRAQANHTFTTPSQPGTYTLGASCSTFGEYRQQEYEYTVTAPTSTECSDGQNNNDGDSFADIADPQCHTDCNANNPGSYVANHNSESTPPNGTCPAAPTLQLNGRPAPIPPGAFNFIKNFFTLITAKAFAGE